MRFLTSLDDILDALNACYEHFSDLYYYAETIEPPHTVGMVFDTPVGIVRAVYVCPLRAFPAINDLGLVYPIFFCDGMRMGRRKLDEELRRAAWEPPTTETERFRN